MDFSGKIELLKTYLVRVGGLFFQQSLGIEFSENRTSLAYVKGSLKGPKLVSHEIFYNNESFLTKSWADEVGIFIDSFILKNNIPSVPAYIGIDHHMAIVRNVVLPTAVKDDLRSTLTYEMEKYVPIAADDLYFDYQITGVDKTGDNMDVALFVVRQGGIEKYLKALDSVDIRRCGIETSLTAAVNCLNERVSIKSDGEYVLLKNEGEKSEIGFVKNSILVHSRSLTDVDGNTSKYDTLGAEIDKADDLFSADSPFIRVVCLGKNSEMEFPDDIILSNGKKLAFQKPEEIEPTVDSDVVSAFGLALKGIKKVPVEINLLPEAFRQKTGKFSYNIMFWLLGLLLVSLVCLGGSNIWHNRMLDNSLDEEIERLRADAGKAMEMKQVLGNFNDRIGYLNDLNENAVIFPDIFMELTERIPESAWVRSMVFKKNTINIEGIAESASELIAALEASSMFRDVSFSSPIVKNKEGKESYKISIVLVQRDMNETK